MRTETVVKVYNVYKYNELSDEAKKRVKEWYLEDRPAEFFTDDCEQDLYNLFGENDLKVQYSLASCQGDGFNIYGKIKAKNIFECLEKHNGGTQLEEFEDMLTEKEKKTILHYAEECGDIELPMNHRYCYCIASHIDIKNEWYDTLSWYNDDEDINTETLEKFERMVQNIFITLCSDYEKQGYEYFYEISDEDLEETCEVNDYEFLEDGTLF